MNARARVEEQELHTSQGIFTRRPHSYHLVRDEHPLELLRNSGCPVRDMAVAYYEHEFSEVAHPMLLLVPRAHLSTNKLPTWKKVPTIAYPY